MNLARHLPRMLSICFYLIFCTFGSVHAQTSILEEFEAGHSRGIKGPDVVHWQLAHAEAISDKVIEATFYLTTEGGFSLYEHKLKFLPVLGYSVQTSQSPQKVTVIDPITNKPTKVYQAGEFKVLYESDVALTPEDEEVFTAKVKYIACTDKVCLFPYTQELSAPLIFANLTQPQPKDGQSSKNQLAASQVDLSDQSTGQGLNKEVDLKSKLADIFKSKGTSWWLLLGIVFLGGLLTNLTPCVFPMIPITMRVLAGQTKKPLAASSAYAFGILFTYSALGIFAASTGSLFGSLMASKTFNIIFAIVMLIFGFTMLGFGNFAKLQMLGSRLGNNKEGSLWNAMMMGSGAGLVASPCTGPILAALLAFITEQNDFMGGSMLMVTYSFGFALPYVFLGSLAGNLSQVKVPGGVQVGIKVFFAAIMFTLGLYYLRIPFYGLLKSLQAQWGIILLVSSIVGVASYGLVLAKSSLHTHKKFQIIPMVFLGLMFFSAINYNYTAQLRATDDAFSMMKDDVKAFALARKTNKWILIDNWAEWCEACKKMDVTTFIDPAVVAELQKNWVGIKKDLTEDSEETDAHMEKYGLASLPTLVLLPPSGDIEGMYKIEGYVNAASLLDHIQKFKEDQSVER